ncbi:MAG: tetratricopeptide repeat protein, partial [Rhodospirillaceae bacterium]|nr:tetratricopeptide repeat protein [Rhodospirillaceae bacterium]
IYRRRGAHDAAAAAYERATRYEPGLIEAYLNLCNTYRDSCNEARIPDVAERGLRVDPRNAQLWLLRAEAGFTAGRLAEGWRDYGWRFTSAERPVDRHHYDLPLWNGEDLSGKSILVWCEQGVGDEIIFASMIPGLAKAAKRCVLHTTPRLAPLFARAFPAVEVHGGHVPAEVVRTLDLQTPMGSVGQWRRPSFGSFPAATGYLKADPGQTAALRAKYKNGCDPILVGLAWRSTAVSDAAEKSIGLAQWGNILGTPGVTFVNLQYGDTHAEITAARTAFNTTIVDDATIDGLANLDAFAAQVAAMDLVISSSNTAAHMAGALGVPTWCMVPRALGSGRRWYWFGAGNYSPWYRAMTLFRQTQADWTSVLADVERALTDLMTALGGPATPGGIGTQTPRALLDAARGHLKNGAPQDALPLAVRALEMEPTAEAHDLYGRILSKLGHYEEAAAAYRQTLALQPGVAGVHNNLGTALRRAGSGMEAEAHYAEAHRLQPDHPSILLNYATALAENDRLHDAIGAYDRLIALKPDYADAHYNRAAVLMSLGRFEEGWAAFAWRLRRGGVHVRPEDFPQPLWSGEDLATKHVLVWTDLGIGEEVLAASFIPDVVKTARRVTLLCSARLLQLFRRSFPDAIVEVRAAPLPAAALSKDVDLQMSMAELGAVFRRSFDAFPSRDKFLLADQNLRNRLREKYLAGRENTKLVGIAWRSIHPEIGRQKSIPLTAWLPILKTPGLTFVNLQYGDCRAELHAVRKEHGITIVNDLEIDHFGDLDPVAAQVAAMDLVVSVSNTAAHLAGALGVPSRVMTPRGLGRLWYWFRGGNQCPWYPATVLHTPQSDNGWDDVIQHLVPDLKRWVGTSHG